MVRVIDGQGSGIKARLIEKLKQGRRPNWWVWHKQRAGVYPWLNIKYLSRAKHFNS